MAGTRCLLAGAVWVAGAVLAGCSGTGSQGTGSGGTTATGGVSATGSGGVTSPAGTGGHSASGGTTAGSGGATTASGGAAPASGGITAPASGGAGGKPASAGSGGRQVASGGSAGHAPATGGRAGASAQGGGAGGTNVPGSGGSAGTTGLSPALTKTGETLLTDAGLTIVSYGGYLNGESFQEDGVVSYAGYQYAAFWNSARHVVVARRALPAGAWTRVELTDYTNSEADAHNTISLGLCPGDGTLHLAFDHHGSTLHYRKSVGDLITHPDSAAWTASSFSAVTGALVGATTVTQVTYPRFVTEPGGGKMLFEARIGASGSGDEYLWEYSAASHAWISLGRYFDGTTDSINAYPHGLTYGRGGTRLHLAWCWRETPDATTNHDLLYIYSDDNGRTWKNNDGATVATTGTSSATRSSTGIKVWTIDQNRGLINQEHLAVDDAGRVHVLLSHLPDGQPDDSNFDSARTKTQYFDYWRDPTGKWTRTAMGLPSIANFRGKLAISSSGDVYAVLPDLRIAAASPATNFATWVVLDTSDKGRFFSDPLIDTARLSTEDSLTVIYPQKSSGNIYALEYTVR